MSRASRLRTRPLPSESVAIAIKAPTAVGAGGDPAELRARRLSGRDVVLGGSFDLTDEITVALAPLAPTVADRSRSSSVRDAVDDVRDAVDGLTAVVARMLAEVDARLRTSGLADAEAAAARRALLQLHRRPRLRDIAEADLADGTWSETLVAHVRPHSAPLADLLARAFPPGQTRFAASRSEQVLEPLREFDRASPTSPGHSTPRATPRRSPGRATSSLPRKPARTPRHGRPCSVSGSTPTQLGPRSDRRRELDGRPRPERRPAALAGPGRDRGRRDPHRQHRRPPVTTTEVRSDDIADWPPRPGAADAVLASPRHGIEATVPAVAYSLALRARSISPEASRVAAEGMVRAVADLVAVVGGDRADEFDPDLSGPSWTSYLGDEDVADGGWIHALGMRALHCSVVKATTQADAQERPTLPPSRELVAALARLKHAASALSRSVEKMRTQA